jgi:hypothetical protein
MKRKINALEITAFAGIIVIGGLIYIGMKYKPSESRKPASGLEVIQQETETTSRVARTVDTSEVKPGQEAAGAPVTIVLRSEKTVTGVVASRDDTMVTLQTEGGVTNITWRMMSTNSFSQLHPELYRKLLARMLARHKKKEEEMRKKGFIQYKGEWLTKKEMLAKKFRFSNQRVNTTVRSGQFRQADKSPGGSSMMNRNERGVLMISFRGLDPEQGYVMKAEGCQFLKYRKWHRGSGEPEYTSNMVSKAETLYGKDEYSFEYEFLAYTQYKGSARSNNRYGYESEDFAVKVWLDGELIYEKPKGTFGEYFVIDSF